MFDQYDSINALISKNVENKQKANDIIQKIKIIYNEYKNSPELNIKNISIYIDNFFQKRKIEINKIMTENIFKVEENKSIAKKPIYKVNKIDLNISSKKKEKNNSQNTNNTNAQSKNNNVNTNLNLNLNKELDEVTKKLQFSEKEIEKDKDKDKGKSLENGLIKEIKLIGKKRVRDRKKKENINLEKRQNEKDANKDNQKIILKRKIKKKKIIEKENENNCNKISLKEQDLNCKNNNKISINNKQLKKPKKEPIKTKTNKVNSNNNSNKNTPIKNKDIKTRRNYSKNSKNSSPKITNIKEVKSSNKKNNSTKSPNKKEEKKVIKKKIITEKKDDENNINQINDNENKNIIKKENNINTSINTNKKQPKAKKKGKRKDNFIIDEELKKSTPIRNLKKQPKGILKKTSLTQTFIINSPPPKAKVRSKSSEKKVTFSSDKNKKFKTFSEIFQSPSKLKATPLKRKINSEKKSSHKKNNILVFEEDKNEVFNNFVGKKRNISFNCERIVKEYNPKTPVRDVKAQLIRKSPLERKKNQSINLN